MKPALGESGAQIGLALRRVFGKARPRLADDLHAPNLPDAEEREQDLCASADRRLPGGALACWVGDLERRLSTFEA